MRSIFPFLLFVLFVTVAIGMFGVGLAAGDWRTKSSICGDIDFYYGADKELLKVRGCEEK